MHKAAPAKVEAPDMPTGPSGILVRKSTVSVQNEESPISHKVEVSELSRGLAGKLIEPAQPADGLPAARNTSRRNCADTITVC